LAPKAMTLDDLEHQNRENCVEITKDRPEYLAYETFSIKRSFH